MRLERVIAKDARRATEQVIATFGPDALIISNQRVNGMTEIVVAVETEDGVEASPPREAQQTARVFAPRADQGFSRSLIESLKPPVAADRGSARVVAGARTAEPEVADREPVSPSSTIQDVPPFLRNLATPPKPQAHPTTEPAPSKVRDEAALCDAPVTRAAVPETEQPAAAEPVDSESSDASDQGLDSARARELVDMVRAELASMRHEIALSRQVESFPPGGSLNASLQPLAGALAAAGAPSGLRTLLLDQVRECDDIHEAVEQMKRQLGATLTPMERPDHFEGIHVIAGPSGAGKTQMLCRIAARHVSMHGPNSVAILSFADNRIGAWTQLQMLASRLGVDCFRVNGPDLLGPMLGELDTRKLVLVDTPGTGFVDKLDGIRRCAPKALFNLVMPADSSISGIARFIPSAPVTWHSVMVSKLDESACAWPLIQALCNHPIPLSVGSNDPAAEAPAIALSPADLVRHAFDQLELPAKPAGRTRSPRASAPRRTTTRVARHAA